MTETEIAVSLTEHDNQIKSLKHRMDEAEVKIDQIHELVTSVKLLAQKQDDLITSVGDLKSDVKTIKDEPGKKWNNATQTIISGIISAIVAAVCALIINLL